MIKTGSTVKFWDDWQAIKNEEESRYGIFLQFGIDFDDLEGTGAGLFTAVIIETEEGDLILRHPSLVKVVNFEQPKEQGDE